MENAKKLRESIRIDEHFVHDKKVVGDALQDEENKVKSLRNKNKHFAVVGTLFSILSVYLSFKYWDTGILFWCVFSLLVVGALFCLSKFLDNRRDIRFFISYILPVRIAYEFIYNGKEIDESISDTINKIYENKVCLPDEISENLIKFTEEDIESSAKEC